MLIDQLREFSLISLMVLLSFGVIYGVGYLGYRFFKKKLWVGVLLSLVVSFYVATLSTDLYLFLLSIPSILLLIIYDRYIR
ncbi:MAG: hypothetical protein K0Q87_1357 [Neobacillus sp.]|jgi:hypothetical protein|nr:hypothetical protein [Neobacillus sp.]